MKGFDPRLVMAFAGVLFGVGLAISGMTQPSKVVGFLDVLGRWDPSLAFVMGGALGVHLLLGRIIRKRTAPLYDDRFHLPAATGVNVSLVAGAAIFGVGWGMGGFCPGPAIVTAGTGATPALVFVAAMAVGMAVHHVTARPKST